jgi:hypothetical protein
MARYWCRLSILLLVVCAPMSCTFVRYPELDEGRATQADLTRLITLAEEACGEGSEVSDWLGTHGDQLMGFQPTTWSEALSSLYARRSASIVRHNPWFSPSGTLFSMWWEAPLGINYLVGGLMVLPFELVVQPVAFGVAAGRHASVNERDLLRAVDDIERARQLGYESARVDFSGFYGWPTWCSLHLDRVGYDAQWQQLHVDDPRR